MSHDDELFTKFFAAGTALVRTMDDLELTAHIEQLRKIAFEAKANLHAAHHEVRERSAKNKKAKGFLTTVEVDDVTSDAIKTIKERQKKLDKREKMIEFLMEKAFVSREEAEKMTSATTILEMRNKKGTTVVDNVGKEEPKNFTNPFAGREAELDAEEVEIKAEVEQPKQAEKFNPFES